MRDGIYQVSRVETIDEKGRGLVMYAPVEFHIQDDGKTLKVFLPDVLEKYISDHRKDC